MQTRAHVSTEHGQKYMQQLCKHWGHRFATTSDDTSARIDFGEETLVDIVVTDTELQATITCPALEDIEDMEDVVADHIKRFAFREDLDFHWKRGG